MKLSEAIRLGAMLKPQTFGRLADEIGTCALGAAEDAAGAPWFDLWLHHPAIEANCPVCEHGPMSRQKARYATGAIITYQPTPAHLNDQHRWTREQIADWVATIEPSEPSTEGDTERTESAQAEDAVAMAVGNRNA